MPKTRTTLVAASLVTALAAAAALYPTAVRGQQPAAADAGAADLVGRTATVEYKPLAAAGGQVIQKQRAGVIRKLSGDWVVLEEAGVQVAVPREMVLEIRFDKK